MTDLAENLNIRTESTQCRELPGWCSLEDLKSAGAEEYGCEEQHPLRRHSRNHEARRVLLHLAATHCRGRHTLSELGLAIGPITVGALSHAQTLMAKRIRASEYLSPDGSHGS